MITSLEIAQIIAAQKRKQRKKESGIDAGLFNLGVVLQSKKKKR